MATHVVTDSSFPISAHERHTHAAAELRFLAPIGRVLFVLLFLMAVPGHFSAQTIDHAAAQGTPLANIAVPLSGVLALLGGLSVALGYKARIGALLLALFLIPVTIIMHRFWGLPDAQAAMLQRIMFFKNVSMLGTTALIGYFGAGPFSLDALAQRRASAPPAPVRSR